MATGYYESDTMTTTRPLRVERDYLMAERFYPGEFGWVALLAVASLFVYSLAIWGLVSEAATTASFNMSTQNYASSSLLDYPSPYTSPYPSTYTSPYTSPYTTPDANPLTPEPSPSTR